MSQEIDTLDLEAEIAALIKQAGEQLRQRDDEHVPGATAPPLQPECAPLHRESELSDRC
ncbi:MAG: hypothetical protein IT537_11065 [Hyphomicrobiales bacterium]|nr:hypothetical protein [Hyphomicrobiales bacterium]